MGFEVYGNCTMCNDGVEKRLVSRAKGICLHHYHIQEREKKKDKKVITIKKTVKQHKIESEDVKFYKLIWKDRKHKSEVGGEDLGPKMSHWFMSHILTKKNYPHYRHNPENILLMTKAEHFQWEFGTVVGGKWQKVKELQDRLREEYNQKERDGEWSKLK